MKRAVRWTAAAVAFIVVASLAGLTELAALVVMFAFFIGIFVIALPDLRPKDSRGRERSARRITFLARYGDELTADSPVALLVVAFATAAVVEVMRLPLSAAVPLVVVAAILYLFAATPVATVTAVGGAVAATLSLFLAPPGCVDTTSPPAIALYVVAMVAAVGVFLSVRSGRVGFLPRPLSSKTPFAISALLVFGFLDFIGFVVRPGSLEIWGNAPGWAPYAMLASIVAIAFFAAYGPGVMLALVAAGLAFGEFTVAVLATSIAGPESCGRPIETLLMVTLFAVIGMVGYRFK